MKTLRVVLVVVMVGGAALAQEAADAGTPAEPVAAPAAAVQPPAQPAGIVLPEAVTKVLSMFRLYGTLKPTVSFAGSAVESFNQPNLTAVTAAGNPVLSVAPTNPRLSFQMGQSRLGVWFGEGTKYRGQVELDFVDFAKASPTVASLPRLRIAKLEWAPNDNLTVVAGQDWGLEQPINPFGINLVGGAFQAGNTAFMRQQAKLLLRFGDVELGAAGGLQTNNNTAKDGLTELSFTPTAALRLQYFLGKRGRIGVSGIVTSLLLRAGTDSLRTFAGEGGVFGEVSPVPNWTIRFEGYGGQNTANLFLLGLGQGRAGTDAAIDVTELGGFVSTRVSGLGPIGLYATFGGAGVLNPQNVAPSYSYPGTVDPANPPPFSAATLAGTGPGIVFNLHGRVGLDVTIGKGLSAMVEGFWYRTKFALQSVDVGRAGSVSQTFGGDFGFLWTF
jgi:hypothetical protein